MDAKIVVVMRMYWQYSFYITVGTCHPQVAVKEDLSALMLLKSEKQSSYNSWTLTGTSSYLERPITETILTYAYKIPIAVMLMINQLADTHIDTWTSLWAA